LSFHHCAALRQSVPGLWNLDALDGKSDMIFKFGNLKGTGVNIYVLDTVSSFPSMEALERKVCSVASSLKKAKVSRMLLPTGYFVAPSSVPVP
jgi:hypothetical protein